MRAANMRMTEATQQLTAQRASSWTLVPALLIALLAAVLLVASYVDMDTEDGGPAPCNPPGSACLK
jgi:hypothetical protein